MNKPDSRGWKLTEKARIIVAHLLFVLIDRVYTAAWHLSGHRIYLRLRGDGKGQTQRVWLWLAGEGYLYDDLKRGDMPEHLRAGGIWR